MTEPWLPALVFMLGMAFGQVLAAYAAWMVRVRRSEPETKLPWQAAMAASLVNGAGWLTAGFLCPSIPEAADLGLMVSAAVTLTLIDVKARLIPNELVAALLALSAGFAFLNGGLAVFPGRLVGLLVALTLFLVAMLLAGPGKVGGGDVKLAAAVGFATGFPGVLWAVLAMALAAVLTGAAGMVTKKMGFKTPMPFAGFLTAGLVAARILDITGAVALFG